MEGGLDLPSSGDLDTLCEWVVGGCAPVSGETAHACAYIHMINRVGFLTLTPPFGTCRGIPSFSFWELGTGEHNHSFLTSRTSQRPLLQVQIHLFLVATARSGLLLCSLKKGFSKHLSQAI